MSRRSKAREVALQMLYQLDVNPDVGSDTLRAQIRDELHRVDEENPRKEDERVRDEEAERFCWHLVSGVMETRRALDERIEAVAENWSLARMAITDRNALRIGAFELTYTDTPHRVVIDEAIELARTFGSANSPQFVNGLLDRLVPPHRREERPPAASAPSED